MDETHARTRCWRERSEAGAGTDGIRLRRHGFRSARMAARLRFPRNSAPIQKPDLRSLLWNEVAAAQAVLTGLADLYSSSSAGVGRLIGAPATRAMLTRGFRATRLDGLRSGVRSRELANSTSLIYEPKTNNPPRRKRS